MSEKPPVSGRDENSSPDAMKMHAANERTFLAWMRTSVSLVGLGYALGKFSIYLEQGERALLDSHSVRQTHIGGVLLALLGLACGLLALGRYARTRKAIIESGNLTLGASSIYVVGTAFVVIAVALVFLLMRSG